MKFTRAAAVAAASVLTLAAPLVGQGSSTAAEPVTPPGPVSTTAASFTPWLPASAPGQFVQEIVQCGPTMYAVGKIGTVNQGTSTFGRGNAFSFSATTGQMTGWNPQVNGTVKSITFSPDCATAYLGGVFTAAGGVSAKNLVAVDAATGAVISSFRHSANAGVDTLEYTHGVVLTGGSFTSINGSSRRMLASLDPRTGVATSYANLAIAGGYPKSPNSRVFKMALSHSGSKVLITGVFTNIGGQPRQQVAMLDLDTPTVTVDGWYPVEFNGTCQANANFYTKGASWSPDDQTVYAATTGYKPPTGPGSSTSLPRGGVCDAAIALPVTSTTVYHTWINYTGCDSLFDVVADQNDVYVGGHQRFLDNTYGCDAAGPGSAARSGIGGVDPVSGKATAWNPGRSRGHGVNDLLLTPQGLWIASDNGSKLGASQKCAGALNHGGICLLPYS